MTIPLKKLFFAFIVNSILFIFLMISIQNSFKKVKVNLILTETIQLPLSFVSGIFFISGSITGSLLTVNMKNKEDS